MAMLRRWCWSVVTDIGAGFQSGAKNAYGVFWAENEEGIVPFLLQMSKSGGVKFAD